VALFATHPVCREYTDPAAASRRGTINAAATRAAIITAEVPARTMFSAIVLLCETRCFCIREISPISLRPPRQRPVSSASRGSALKPIYALNMQEMAGLYPDLAAFRTSLGSERAACREPQPGLHLEVFAGLMEIAIQRQHLGAAR